MGSHFLLQGIFPTQGSNPRFLRLLHWRADFFTMETPGKPFCVSTWALGNPQKPLRTQSFGSHGCSEAGARGAPALRRPILGVGLTPGVSGAAARGRDSRPKGVSAGWELTAARPPGTGPLGRPPVAFAPPLLDPSQTLLGAAPFRPQRPGRAPGSHSGGRPTRAASPALKLLISVFVFVGRSVPTSGARSNCSCEYS